MTDANREFLREWLPWLDATTSVEDTGAFIEGQLSDFAKGEAVHVTIFWNGVVAGAAGYTIDTVNKIGSIGYWLASEYTGHGIMTAVVSDLVLMAREDLGLQKVAIKCAARNHKSRVIPKRLGFAHEGTLRRAQRQYDRWLDHEIYALLIDH